MFSSYLNNFKSLIHVNWIIIFFKEISNMNIKTTENVYVCTKILLSNFNSKKQDIEKSELLVGKLSY